MLKIEGAFGHLARVAGIDLLAGIAGRVGEPAEQLGDFGGAF